MARASQDFETFRMQGQAGGNFASTPFNDGGSAMAAAAVFSRLGAQLGKMADDAAVRTARNAGMAAATDAIGLPEVSAVTRTEKAPALPEDPGEVVYDPLTGKQRAKKPVGAVTNPDAPVAKAKGLGSVAQRAALARGYFEKLGYAPHQAAGIVGNLIQESTLRTAVVGDKNIPGGSVGIGQWNRERKAALMNFAQKRGTPWHDFETQLAFVHHELTTSEKTAGDMIRRAKTLDEATAGMISFERPIGWSPGNPRGGHGWQNRLRYASQVLGGAADTSLPPTAADSISAGVPSVAPAALQDVTTTTLQYKVPMPKPLALRNDGTLAGNAYDAAVAETAGWRMTAGLDAAMTQAYSEHANDPEGFAKAMKEVAETYVKQAEAFGPEVKQSIAKRAMESAETFVKSVNADAQRKAESERQTNALAALDAEQNLIERQAYLLGATQDGDAKLGTLANAALARIEQAAQSGAITPAEAYKKRAATLETLTVSRIKGVFDALETPQEKLTFAQGLMEQWKAKDSPLGAIPLSSMLSLSDRLEREADQARVKAEAGTKFDRAKMAQMLQDDLASKAATGTGIQAGGQPLDYDTVAKMMGEDVALKWLQGSEEAVAVQSATAGMEQMDPATLTDRVNGLKPEQGEPSFALKQQAYEAAAKKAAAIMEERKTNPALAVDKAFPDIAAMAQETKLDDPASLAELIAARAAGQKALGVPVGNQLMLSDGEAKAIAGLMNQSPEAAAKMAQVLSTAAGPRMESVLRQVSDHGPQLAAAVDLMSRGGGDDALRYISQQQAVERDPAYKAKEVKPARIAEVAEPAMPAFAALPARAGVVQQNAMMIYKAMARERGMAVDAEGEEATALMERAMQVAAGAQFRGGKQLGGIAAVNGHATLLPVGMDPESVQQKLRGLTDDVLKKLPPIVSANGVEVRAKDLREARLVAVKDGVYRVALGDPLSDDPRYVAAKDGGFWLLDVRALPTVSNFAVEDGLYDPMTGVMISP